MVKLLRSYWQLFVQLKWDSFSEHAMHRDFRKPFLDARFFQVHEQTVPVSHEPRICKEVYR
jgi:hypothetical protein